jgi:lysophospholipase L1-like esterase
MKRFNLGCIGARTTAFKTVRFDEVTLQRYGINVESFDLSELIFKVNAKADDDRAVLERVKRLEAYANFSLVPERNKLTLAKISVVIDEYIEEYHLKEEVLPKSVMPLAGKQIVNFGDSIFGGARPPQDISTILAELTGAIVYNCGFGGCRMSYHPQTNFDAFSMTKLSDAITTRNFTLQDNALTDTTGGGVPDYFADGLATLKSVDFTKVDIVTIAYGTNDWNGVALDDGTTRSVAGALRYSVETILATYPHIKIFVCCPTYRFWMDASGNFVEDSDTKPGGWGYTIPQLCDKEREVAEELHLPFIDNYNIGINKFNRSHYFPAADGTHQNINGRRLIAEHIANELY